MRANREEGEEKEEEEEEEEEERDYLWLQCVRIGLISSSKHMEHIRSSLLSIWSCKAGRGGLDTGGDGACPPGCTAATQWEEDWWTMSAASSSELEAGPPLPEDGGAHPDNTHPWKRSEAAGLGAGTFFRGAVTLTHVPGMALTGI